MASSAASAPALRQEVAGEARPNRSEAPRRDPQRHTYGAIDLGTNNCRLLVARPNDNGFTVIDAFSRIVRLGEGLAQTGELSQEAMDRAVAALAICADKLRRRNVSLARSVATEACRRARNGEHFAERVRDETGILLDIIPPQEEARLAVLGCHKLLEPGDGPALIFDIGGGSTELVLVDQAEGIPRIRSWFSAPWGVVSLTESEGREALEGPDRMKAYLRMRERARHAFARFAAMLPEDHEGIRLLGTSGTVTTLGSVYLALPSYDRRAVDGLHIPTGAMLKISEMIAAMDYEERSNLPCIGSRPRRSGRRRSARSLRRSSKSGRRRISASPTAASARAYCARSWPATAGTYEISPPLQGRGRGWGLGRHFAPPLRRWTRLFPSPEGEGIVKRVKTARGRKDSSTRWLERQLNDPYVKRAKAENYRSRAAYKLIELDEKFGLLKGVRAVVDLGIAPGGWSQVVRRTHPQAAIVGIDLLPTDPIEGVTILEMDFMAEDAPQQLKDALGGPADLVMSDMAANTVGHQQTDHLRTMGLVEAALDFAAEMLKPGRHLRRQGPRGRRRQQSRRRDEAPLHHRETRQAPGEPEGVERMVCGRAGV